VKSHWLANRIGSQGARSLRGSSRGPGSLLEASLSSPGGQTALKEALMQGKWHIKRSGEHHHLSTERKSSFPLREWVTCTIGASTIANDAAASCRLSQELTSTGSRRSLARCGVPERPLESRLWREELRRELRMLRSAAPPAQLTGRRAPTPPSGSSCRSARIF
jgi:hypothetical protein